MVHYSYRIDRNRSIPDHWLPEARNGSFGICRRATNGPKKAADIQQFPGAGNPLLYKNEQICTKLYRIATLSVVLFAIELIQRVASEGRLKGKNGDGSAPSLNRRDDAAAVPGGKRQYRRGLQAMIIIGNSEFFEYQCRASAGGKRK